MFTKKTNNEVLTFKKFYENIHRRNTSYEYGALLNLKTMERYDNVCHHGWCNKYLVNGGYIDLEHFTIIQDNCETSTYELILRTTDMEPKNTSNNISEEKLGNVLKNIRKKTTINQKLLAQIKNYIQEVKENPDSENELGVYFDDGYMFSIINNSTQPYDNILSYKSGVSLYVPIFEWGDEDIKKFKECELYHLFEEIECDDDDDVDIDDDDDTIKEPNGYYINFSFDSKSLCAAVQYLAEIYVYSTDKIKLEENVNTYKIKLEENGNTSDGGPWSDPKQWLIAGILGIIWILYSIFS